MTETDDTAKLANRIQTAISLAFEGEGEAWSDKLSGDRLAFVARLAIEPLIQAQATRIAELKAERDALAAVIKKARVRLGTEDDWADDLEGSWPAPIALQAILAAAPSDILADVKADVWDEGAHAGRSTKSPRSIGELLLSNPYRAESADTETER